MTPFTKTRSFPLKSASIIEYGSGVSDDSALHSDGRFVALAVTLALKRLTANTPAWGREPADSSPTSGDFPPRPGEEVRIQPGHLH